MLDDYFSKEQIQDALRDIGERTSGNKDGLARRLCNNWESHNRDIYELLDFTDIDSLEMICHQYKLDATFKEKDALKGKIEKANLLVLDKKPVGVIDRNVKHWAETNVHALDGPLELREQNLVL